MNRWVNAGAIAVAALVVTGCEEGIEVLLDSDRFSSCIAAAGPVAPLPDLDEHTRVQPGIATKPVAKPHKGNDLGALLDDLIPTKGKR